MFYHVKIACYQWIGNVEGRKGKVVDGFVEGGDKMGESKREIHKIGEIMMHENKQTSNFSHFIHKRQFHKIYISRGRERIVQSHEGCVSSRGATV